MTFFQALILGIVQGLTEFLPISSSGHLVLLPFLFEWSVQSQQFDVALHVGTLLAIVVFFRARLWALARAVFVRDASGTFARAVVGFLAVGTVPAVVAGVFLSDIENTLRAPWLIALNLLGWGVVLWGADWYCTNRSAKNSVPATTQQSLADVGFLRAFVIGVAQAIALVPGTSRSGITITAALFGGLHRAQAVEFSFLLSIPVVAGAALLTFVKNPVVFGASLTPAVFATGILSSFVVGYGSLKLLSFMAQKYRFWPFALYRIVLGFGILLWLLL